HSSKLSFLHPHTAPSGHSSLSLHDALPIWSQRLRGCGRDAVRTRGGRVPDRRAIPSIGGCPRFRRSPSSRWRRAVAPEGPLVPRDRKSTRLNSSHDQSSYAVFCLKKKIYTT